MVFSSLTFLFIFLPAVLLFYFLLPGIRAKNAVLCLFSLVFYAWGEPVYVLLMIASILLNWLSCYLNSSMQMSEHIGLRHSLCR